jgi:pantetheine-phosphate adenylyltransferase
VIAGELRGRRLAAPSGTAIRPTSDRVREAIFDILYSQGGVEGAQVVDLFAGSGALGIEALSRGAASVTFVERDPVALAAVRANLASVGLPGAERDGNATVVRADVDSWVATTASRYDLALVDPPYRYEGSSGNGHGERCLVRIALIPGSFDPVHNGHLEVIERAARLFDEVVVATLRNPQKSEALFELDERQEMLEESLAHLVNVRIVSVKTLVVNVAHDVGASAIVKGLRAVSDFENELQMAQMNKQLSGVETLFIPTSSAHSFIASRLLREVARFGGDVTSFVPKVVAQRLQEKYSDE